MNKCKQSLYLSGPIEFTKDAYTWREIMYRGLHDTYDVIIPDQIKCPYVKTDTEYGPWVKKNFIMPDMADVARCHYFFVYINHIYSSGTYGELTLASWLNKEIICFLDGGIKVSQLPQWIIGSLSDAHYVDSFDLGVEYFKELLSRKQ